MPGILPEFSFNFVKLCKVNTMTRSLQTQVTRGLKKLVRGCTVQNVDVREAVHPHTEFGGRIQETSRENSDHACQLPIATTNTSAHQLVNRKGLFRLTVGRFQAELGLGQGSLECSHNYLQDISPGTSSPPARPRHSELHHLLRQPL